MSTIDSDLKPTVPDSSDSPPRYKNYMTESASSTHVPDSEVSDSNCGGQVQTMLTSTHNLMTMSSNIGPTYSDQCNDISCSYAPTTIMGMNDRDGGISRAESLNKCHQNNIMQLGPGQDSSLNSLVDFDDRTEKNFGQSVGPGGAPILSPQDDLSNDGGEGILKVQQNDPKTTVLDSDRFDSSDTDVAEFKTFYDAINTLRGIMPEIEDKVRKAGAHDSALFHENQALKLEAAALKHRLDASEKKIAALETTLAREKSRRKREQNELEMMYDNLSTKHEKTMVELEESRRITPIRNMSEYKKQHSMNNVIGGTIGENSIVVDHNCNSSSPMQSMGTIENMGQT